MQSIGSTQYQAALAVSGAWKGSNTSKLYEELGWGSLTDRRWYRRLLQFYKIINDLEPSYLKDIIPPLRRSLYGHPRHVFNEFRCHSFTFMHSFFPDSIKSWNNIGREFTSLSPISKFKEALLSVIRPAKKSVFAIHNPTGIKKLFQLRVGLTQLKSHRKNHNFLDTPSDLCICNFESENTELFFCRCPLFSIPRLILVDTVSNILSQKNIHLTNLNMKDLVKIYLYGDSRFKACENRLILLATIKFITDSNRFAKQD